MLAHLAKKGVMSPFLLISPFSPGLAPYLEPGPPNLDLSTTEKPLSNPEAVLGWNISEEERLRQEESY